MTMQGFSDRQLVSVLKSLYRGRPYTKGIPFAFTFAVVPGQSRDLWAPQGATFEYGLIIARATVAIDLNFADTTVDNVCGMLAVPTTTYGVLSLAPGTYRSLSYQNAKLIAVDPSVAGIATTIKGMVFGWEVDRNGYYR